MDHKKQLLEDRQSLSLQDKINLTVERLIEFYIFTKGKCYLGLSGGKDSLVLAHIIKNRTTKEIPFVFVNTGIDNISVVKKAKEWCTVELKPKVSWLEVWKNKGIPFPTKQQAHFLHQAKTGKSKKHTKRLMTGIMPDGSKTQFKIANKWQPLLKTDFHFNDVCCNALKKEPFKRYEKQTGNKKISGVMATESNQRMFRYLKTGCIVYEEGKEECKPLSFWTEQDILLYCFINKLEIAEVYGSIVKDDGKLKTTGESRTGCEVCLFGVHLDKSPNRLERLKSRNPHLHKFIVDDLKAKDFLDMYEIKY